MTGWTQINGTAVALPQENVDTDQLIPARFMSAPRADDDYDYLFKGAPSPLCVRAHARLVQCSPNPALPRCACAS